MKKRIVMLVVLLAAIPLLIAALPRPVDQQNIEVKNLLVNPGFENGLAKYSVTTAANLTINTSSGSVGYGAQSAAWDPSASGEFLQTELKTIPAGLYSQNCLARLKYYGGDANVDLKVTDGTNTLVSDTLSTAPSAVFQEKRLSFICPSSGSLQIELESTADAAVIVIDDVYLGGNYFVSEVSQAELAGSATFAATTSCAWSRTNVAFGAPATDTDCPGPTVESEYVGDWQTTDADLPQVTINDLPPGRYLVQATMTILTASNNIGVQISDGTTGSGDTGLLPTDADQAAVSVNGVFEYTTAGNRTFAIHLKSASGAAVIQNAAVAEQLKFVVTKFPSATETAYTPEKTAWRVDANISGANADLGSADQTSYTGIEDSGLTIAANSGSLPVEIPCSSTNASTGTTCSVGDESVGVVYTQPVAGPVLACVSFSHFVSIGVSSEAEATFQIVETPNAAQTISTEGNSRVQSGTTTAATEASIDTYPHRVCAVFDFASSGKKTLRLFYEQQTTAGTITSNVVLADAAANNGQRDIHWEVYPIGNSMPLPLILNHVSTEATAGIKLLGFTADASCTVSDETGDWIDGNGTLFTGECRYDMVSGIGTNADGIVCTVSHFGSSSRFCHITKQSVPEVDYECRDDAGTATAAPASVICIVKK